ncbi:MAG: 16S rRNA (guanine(966)-N(2))-methyltransferase RsmD [Oscillospiraceae bacterium]|jgi:16S rRNA (guanine(966)-N(2))-methyltransferase RsmD|nr:16S rRNA (guanine(966)-N(2))-methyltransferase RsmD [Oscillospiraceae bacterium]
MRVITGAARGLPLKTLPGEEVIRPTSQRVKEAMFSAIQFEIEGKTVLDAFAGCGQLGIEALSRGAVAGVFWDVSKEAIATITDNLTRAKLSDKATLRQGDALMLFRRTADLWDIIFLDPPYGQGLLQEAIPLAAAHLSPGGLLLCEAPAKESLPEQAEDVYLHKTYKHGKTKVLLYRRQTAD